MTMFLVTWSSLLLHILDTDCSNKKQILISLCYRQKYKDSLWEHDCYFNFPIKSSASFFNFLLIKRIKHPFTVILCKSSEQYRKKLLSLGISISHVTFYIDDLDYKYNCFIKSQTLLENNKFWFNTDLLSKRIGYYMYL